MQKIALFAICAVLAAFLGDYIGFRYTKVLDDARVNFNKGVDERVAKHRAILDKESEKERKKNDEIVDAFKAHTEATRIKYYQFIEAKEPLKAAEVFWNHIRFAPKPIYSAKECILIAYRDVERHINPQLSLDECIDHTLSAIARDREKVEELLSRLQN